MKLKNITKNNSEKFVLLLIILCFGFAIGIYMGNNLFSTSQTPSSDQIPDNGNINLESQQIILGNLSRSWEPIVLTLNDLPPAFVGLSVSNIRITVYEAEAARWRSIPFQIDEWGAKFEWQDGYYPDYPSITTTTNFGIIGPDDGGGMDSNFFGEDELVFYAHSGAKVTPNMWWEGDTGIYPNRIEVKITDPVDGGIAWMYIYYDSIPHGNPASTWVPYPNQGWNQSDFLAFGEYYNVLVNKTNPDIEHEISSSIGTIRDLLNESYKSYSNITLYNKTFDYYESLNTNKEGNWNGTHYSDRKTELQFPENTSPLAFINEGGDGAVIVSGPVRTIINKRIFGVLNSSLAPIYSIDHQLEYFYMDSKEVTYVKNINDLGLFDINVNYDYDFVVSLNKSVRSNFYVYEGWNNGTLIQNIPNGIANESGEIYSTLGPTGPNPEAPVKLNPDIPDYFLFTSSDSGSAWMYCPRAIYSNMTSSGVYWKDDNSTTEIGLVVTNATPNGSLSVPMKWKYIGSISNPFEAKYNGIMLLRRALNPLNISGTTQTSPIDNLPPNIREPTQIPSPSVNNDTTIVLSNITDTISGVHRAFLVYSNGSGQNTVEMTYLPAQGLYAAEIPQHPYKTNISYFIFANDTFGNIAYTPFDYLGSSSFTNDPIGGPPIGWNVLPVMNTFVQVVAAQGFHRKVVQLFDNNSFAGGWARMNSNPFGPVPYGNAELWVYGDEGTVSNGKFYIEFLDNLSTPFIRLQAIWDTGVNVLNYWNGLSWSNIIPSPFFTNNSWHHLEVVFNCSLSNQTFFVYVNSTKYGPYPFFNPVSNINTISLFTGDIDSHSGYSVWVDALDASWSPRYYRNRNKDTFHTIRQYHGLFSFENDQEGSNPRNWTVFEAGNFTYVNVVNEKFLHRKVVEFFDNSPSLNCGMQYNFNSRTNGTIEWWANGNSENSPIGAFFIQLDNINGSLPVQLLLDWSFGVNSLLYFNGLSYSPIISSPNFYRDTWHHFTLNFSTISDTFNLWVNGYYYGEYNFSTHVNNITSIIFRTGTPETSNNFYAYIDAVDFSWSDDYYLHRNLDFMTVFNFTIFDPYPPPSVKGVTPTNLGTGNTLNVSWTASPDKDVEYYLVYISSNISGPYSLQANISAPTTYTIVSNLTDGQTYYFMVSAVDGVPHFGANSTKKAGIPTDITPPAKITGVSTTVINTGNELNVSWNPSTEPDFVHYLVYRSTNPSFTISKSNWIANTTNPFYHDTGLTDGTTYYYIITAIDDGGPTPNESPPSDTASGTPQDSVPPGQVTGLQVIVVPSGNKLNIEWNAVSGDVSGYRVYRNSTISGFQLITTTSNTYYNDTGLTDGETYWYKIAAIDEVPNEGQNSTAVSGTPQDSIPPNPVSITSITPIPSGNALNITWTTSSSTDIVGYYLYNSTSEFGTYTLLTTILHPTYYYVHSGLMDGQIYWYKVSAYDEAFNPSTNSSAQSGIPADTVPPGQVTGVAVTNLGTGNTLNITWWTASTAPDIVKYMLYRAIAETGPYTNIINITHPTYYYVDSGLTDGVTYYYKISALDEVPNKGTNSTVKSGIPTDITPPAQVQGVNVTVIFTGNELNITWNANTEPDLLIYRVYRSTISGFTPSQANWIANTTNTYYDDTGLIDGTTYYYKITAVDDGGPTQNEGTPSAQ
ncbi:MAG: fibronectin type III domain-containing protein, partial [Candidatus Helarchaeota archaeon]